MSPPNKKDTVNAMKAHVDVEDKRGCQITTPSGVQTMTIINESGLYSLVLGSKLPGARRYLTLHPLRRIRRALHQRPIRRSLPIRPLYPLAGCKEMIEKYQKRDCDLIFGVFGIEKTHI